MVKTVGPLYSLFASGTLGDTMTYVCGLYVRMAARAEKREYSQAQTSKQTKWSEGCKVWQSAANDKEKWKDFVEKVKSSGECPANLEYYMTGFQTFMSFYMDLGPDGWPNYPQPPL